MTKTSISLFGAHRGARAIVNALPVGDMRSFPRWCVADPKEGRAEALAELLRARIPGAEVLAVRQTAAEVQSAAGSRDHLVAALDTAADSAAALAALRPGQTLTYQLAGRTPDSSGRAFVGFQGTVAGDGESRRSAALLLGSLAALSRRASSSEVVDGDLLAPPSLERLRDLLSRATAADLASHRVLADKAGSVLRVSLGGPLRPLAVAPLPGSWREQRTAAIEAVRPLVRGGASIVAAALLGGEPRIHLVEFSVASSGRLVETGLIRLALNPRLSVERPWAAPVESRRELSAPRPALLTD